MKKQSKIFKIFVLVLLYLGMQSCVTYSFTGAPITAKSISIDYFPNKASLINSALSQDFTDAMRDKFVNQTKLELLEQNAELEIEGEIVDYHTTAVAIQGNETAALNRLTISVNVRYTNTLNDEESFEQKFTGFEDYDASRNFSDVESELVSTILERMVQDIFNKALVNW